MTRYRIITLDERGELTGGSDFESRGDDAAVEHSKSIIAPGEQALIWTGDRCLGSIEAPADGQSEQLYRRD